MSSSLPASQASTPSPLWTSQSLGWEPILVEEFQLSPGQIDVPGGQSGHAVALCLAGQPYRLHQVIGRRRYTGLYSCGDISLLPTDIPASFRAEGEDHYLNLQFPTEFLETVVEEATELDQKRLNLAMHFRIRDPHIEQTLMMLRSELHKCGGWVSRLYVESLANVLVIHLLRQYSAAGTQAVQEYRGGLGDRKLLRVSDYIETHLNQPLKMAELAAITGMSQYHFSRLFKQSVGLSPHQYVTRQRIERAKMLLLDLKRSISDVALDCGFSSQSHFGKYFKEYTGGTPHQYRSESKGRG